MTETARQPDGTYGWLLSVVGLVAMTFTFGTPYSYGVFLEPFSETYGLSRVVLATVFSIQLFAFYFGAGTIGIFVTRFSAQRILVTTGVVTVILAPSLYVIDSYLGLLVVFALLGIALGTVYVVLASVIPQWFEKHRGTATGLLFAGNGLSLLILPTAWQLGFDTVGVRRGFLVLVLASGVAFVFAGLCCRRPPWTSKTPITTAELGSWIAQVARSRQFQLLFVGVGLGLAWYYVLAAYAIDLYTSRGLSRMAATALFGAIGGVSIASRLGSGVVADRIGYRPTFVFSLACAAVGSLLLFLPFVSATILATLLFGIALGSVATLYVPVIMQVYDVENDTAVIGLFNLSFGAFALVTPPVGTALVAYSGSYTAVILLTLLSAVLAIWAIRLEERTRAPSNRHPG